MAAVASPDPAAVSPTIAHGSRRRAIVLGEYGCRRVGPPGLGAARTRRRRAQRKHRVTVLLGAVRSQPLLQKIDTTYSLTEVIDHITWVTFPGSLGFVAEPCGSILAITDFSHWAVGDGTAESGASCGSDSDDELCECTDEQSSVRT